MDYVSIIGIAIGLAMDAFAVSITNGALTRDLKIDYALKISLFFGFFQFSMPIIGWIVGKAGEKFIEQADHWIAFIMLAFIGSKMIFDYIKDYKEETKNKRDRLSTRSILMLAIATSIDALATGIILPSAVRANTILHMFIAVIIIGIITFIISICGVYIGKIFGCLLSNYAGLFGGIVLVSIGIKILIEHLFL